MAFFEGGTHRSWPGGRGGRPRGLIPEKGSGKGWLAERAPTHRAGLVRGKGSVGGRRGKGSGGVQGLRFRGG